MTHDNVYAVTAGERVALGDDPETVTVQPACADKHAGHWYCATHADGFSNQLAKDAHIYNDRGAHSLVWICHEHGPEQP